MTLPAGWRLEVHETLPSTSDLVAARPASGEAEGLAVLAHAQTQGRGRAGRVWQSPAGNLAVSVLLRPREPARRAGEWPLLVGLAIADALAPLLPDTVSLALKWPNDVLLNGRKLAGVLIESTLDATGHVEAMVVGIGVNLTAAPALPDRPTAALGDWAAPSSPEAAAERILAAIAQRRAQRAAEGFAPIRAAWLARAHPIGTALQAAGVVGRFAGLAEDGALLLQAGEVTHRITAGDVWPVAAP
jgi:BirA family biotin operon repressor/biotin-[acetyl-CoA-carboxylase] ligase